MPHPVASHPGSLGRPIGFHVYLPLVAAGGSPLLPQGARLGLTLDSSSFCCCRLRASSSKDRGCSRDSSEEGSAQDCCDSLALAYGLEATKLPVLTGCKLPHLAWDCCSELSAGNQHHLPAAANWRHSAQCT